MAGFLDDERFNVVLIGLWLIYYIPMYSFLKRRYHLDGLSVFLISTGIFAAVIFSLTWVWGKFFRR